MTRPPHFSIGDRVVYRDDPGKLGHVIGGPSVRGDRRKYRVRWDDGAVTSCRDFLLLHADPDLDPFSMLKTGQFGRANDLRRSLTHLQLSGRLANIVYSMYATDTEFYAYQYKPVLALLDSPSRGLLVADEVGLGKTIEAGLIWTELRARYNVRRLVVVCPAMLRDKWCFELESKFGVDARQVDAAGLARALGQDTGPLEKAYVCSLQGLRPPKDWRNANPDDRRARVRLAYLLEELKARRPRIDLLVVDEAHKLRNPETQTAKLGRLLRDVSDHVVLLSATPVNNKSEDLFQLLNIVDCDFFSSRKVFPQIVSANEPLLRARKLALDPSATGEAVQAEIRAALDHPLLEDNQQLGALVQEKLDGAFMRERANRVELANRLERANLLANVLTRTRKREVTEWSVVRRPECLDVDLSPTEADFYASVTASIRKYAEERDISDGFLLSAPQRQVSSCMYAAAQSWVAAVPDDESGKAISTFLYEAAGVDDAVTRDVKPLVQHLVSNVLGSVDLDALRTNDSKFCRFQAAIRSHLREYPSSKIVVFSYFKATLHYLEDRLQELGIAIQVLHGSIGENKQDIINRFENDTAMSVLLTSEVASEGVDLQFSSVLVNYDLPWNPMKIEQRIGRLDRIGQRAERISIVNFCYKDTIDQRIYTRLLEKLEIFERALGGTEVMLGEKVAELTNKLMCRELTAVEERKAIDRACMAIEKARKEEEELEANAVSLIAHGGYVLAQVTASRDFGRHVTGLDLKVYVEDYLKRYVRGFKFEESADNPLKVRVRLPKDAAGRLMSHIREERLSQHTTLTTGRSVTCWFSAERPSSPTWEKVTHLHPLIRFIGAELQDDSKRYLPPLVAVRVPSRATGSCDAGTYVFVLQRWTFKGVRDEEEVRARATRVGSAGKLLGADHSWQLVNAAKVEGVDWLSARHDVDREEVRVAMEACEDQLEEDHSRARRQRDDANKDRVAFQIRSTRARRDRELVTQRALLARHRANNQDRVVRMTEGRIDAIGKRFAAEVERLKQQQELRSEPPDQVCVGVIRIEDNGG